MGKYGDATIFRLTGEQHLFKMCFPALLCFIVLLTYLAESMLSVQRLSRYQLVRCASVKLWNNLSTLWRHKLHCADVNASLKHVYQTPNLKGSTKELWGCSQFLFTQSNDRFFYNFTISSEHTPLHLYVRLFIQVGCCSSGSM